MAYVDGFVVPVPRDKLEAYKAASLLCGKVWKELGALEFRECIGDDVPEGKHTSFPMAVKLEEGEVVVFSWIVYESRARRDEINAQVMQDPRLKELMEPNNMPFDGKRLVFGGFELAVDL
ncbi:MAG: DUF1428 domain-containing protein [Sphingomonadaceae bacterium]